jgi:hypothetical protein
MSIEWKSVELSSFRHSKFFLNCIKRSGTAVWVTQSKALDTVSKPLLSCEVGPETGLALP